MGTQVIDSKQNANYFNKKRKQTLGFAFLSNFVVASIVILMLIFQVETTYFTLVSFLLLIGLLVVIFILKPKAMFYSMHFRYHTLLANSVNPYKVNTKFDIDWINSLIRLKFQYGAKRDHYDVLYRISKPVERSAFHSNHILEIITIIKDNQLDFYCDALNDEYKRLWIEHQAKYRISKQVIIQFKKYETFSEEIKNDLDRIIAFNEGSNYLISINCGYFEKSKSNYYLHSNNYYPNLYYKYTVDTIKTITG